MTEEIIRTLAGLVALACVFLLGRRSRDRDVLVARMWWLREEHVLAQETAARRFHRRAQRAESATAKARREAIGQRRRADWWRAEAKRLGWGTQMADLVPEVRRRVEHEMAFRGASAVSVVIETIPIGGVDGMVELAFADPKESN